jgi:hypothetical protein
MAHRKTSKRSKAKAKAILRLPDLEQSKTAVLHSLVAVQFAGILRSCHRRIHRQVLFRTSFSS